VINLLLGHSGALGGTQAALLLLAPFVNKAEVLRIAGGIVSLWKFTTSRLIGILTYESRRQVCCNVLLASLYSTISNQRDYALS